MASVVQARAGDRVPHHIELVLPGEHQLQASCAHSQMLPGSSGAALSHAQHFLDRPGFMKSLAWPRSEEPEWRGAVEQKRTTGFVPPPSPGAVQPGLQRHSCSPAFAARGKAVPQGPAAMRGLLRWAGWLLATGYLVGATGSCWHRCCPGRNNACWAWGARRARCYCDSYCERTGDCCEDYHATCRHAGECREGTAPV